MVFGILVVFILVFGVVLVFGGGYLSIGFIVFVVLVVFGIVVVVVWVSYKVILGVLFF